jgi:hypothetical protein
MTTYYVVPETNGYGDWAIKRSGGIKVSNAQTQKTAVNNLRSNGSPGKKGDTVTVYGSRNKQIVNQFTLQ